jgi:CheY-like chemotaxis protein
VINVLVIEDNQSKFDAIERVLLEVGICKSFIQPVDNKDSALSLLRKKAYEIVILDFQLPTSDGGNKSPNAGFDILKILKHDGRTGKNEYRLPSVIIALTEYNQLFEEQALKFSGLNTFAYHYDPSSSDWKEKIKSFIVDFKASEQVRTLKSEEKKLVITVHGIMSFGKWQNDFKKAYEEKFPNGYAPVNYKYHYFPILGFLIPKARRKEEEEFHNFVSRVTQRYPEATIDIIAHSFGTHLVHKVLTRMDYLLQPKVSKVIFCGSVLKDSTNIELFIEKLKIDKLLNECGINDWPLIMSNLFAVGLGKGGRSGFKSVDSSIIINRYHKGGHSLFFNENHYDEWIRFLENGVIRDLDERAEPGVFKFLTRFFSR